jgi:hypothetical protein
MIYDEKSQGKTLAPLPRTGEHPIKTKKISIYKTHSIITLLNHTVGYFS